MAETYDAKAERLEDAPAQDSTTKRDLQIRQPDQERAVQTFNPLDMEPVAFKRQIDGRKENYDALAMHLRAMLVPDKDFGRIHIANKRKCERPWECSPERAPGHWSGYQLLAAGADKILGILGLGVHYPNEQDFIRAAMKGMPLLDVIVKAHIFTTNNQVVVEGMGACGRDEVNGSLNNAIKRACKRARVDAVLRLPSVSALFEQDFLDQVASQARKNKDNSTSGRQQTVNPKFDTGARLEVMPIGAKLKGQRFDDMDEGALDWILINMRGKPDIWNAAKRAHDARFGGASHTPSEATAEGPAKDSDGEGEQGQAARPAGAPKDDWWSEYDNFMGSDR